jgi:hypothetical protein
MNDLSDAVERLTQSLEALERRVGALETSGRGKVAALPSSAAPTAAPAGAGALVIGDDGRAFAVPGKAMLGIAGAYLLRVAVQSGALPRGPTMVAAVAYAFVWLVPAARAAARAWFASAMWAGTSVAILIPMLWELTLRFRMLPSGATAGILVLFVIAAGTLAWRRHFGVVCWTVGGTVSFAALALGIATRDLAPFLLSLVAMAIAVESAAAWRIATGVRIAVATVADLGVFALIWIYSSPAAARTEYPAMSMPVLLAFAPALLAVYAGSAGMQTLARGRKISFFATAETLVAALLTVWSIAVFWRGHEVLVGAVCLVASAGGYAVAFGRFASTHAWRNFHVYATGSLALLAAGLALSVPAEWLPPCAGVLAVAAVLLAARTGHRTLFFHGLALLFAAALSSGMLQFIGMALMGGFPAAPGWRIWLTGGFVILCYTGLPREDPKGGWVSVGRLLFAAMGVTPWMALAVWVLVRVAATAVTPGAEHIAVIRTVASCAVALTLAWCSSRWQRKELIWLVWASLGFTAVKILVEDLRHGHLGFTAASIFLYAVTLLLVPRLLRGGEGAIRPESD